MLTAPNKDPWLQMGDLSHIALRLFCFPFAGGGASAYRHWQQFMPEGVQLCRVQLPGRENRIQEFPINTMNVLLEALSTQISPYLDKPFAFFGHSMGGIVAYELAARLFKQQGLLPTQLWVSACRPPHIHDKQPIHHLLGEAFIEALRQRGGTHEDLLNSKEYMTMVEPALRGDLKLVENWQSDFDTALICPLTVFGSPTDMIAPLMVLESWKMYSQLPFQLEMFKGGHFFINDPANDIPARVANTLEAFIQTNKDNHFSGYQGGTRHVF